MSTPIPPPVDCQQFHTTLEVSDIRQAVDFYTRKLGFREGFVFGEPPTFAGVLLDQVQIFFRKGTPDPKGCSLEFMVGNADELFAFQRANDVEILCEPEDRHYGIRDYSIRDLYGYRLSFGHNLFNDGPPIKIERVDVPVRLEKRLAALINDLAARKRMSLSSCLEEILLHTCEPLGDGVASPHTKGDLRYIQDLKKKHGIDYDSHGSYRFVEE
jgi:catechol 2,3-dioxygenase-like lactoylglutathione lyase family enzyme